MTGGDPERDIALTIANVLADGHVLEGIGIGDGDAYITGVAMYGMASIQITLSDGRTFLVDVEEGPLATPNHRRTT